MQEWVRKCGPSYIHSYCSCHNHGDVFSTNSLGRGGDHNQVTPVLPLSLAITRTGTTITGFDLINAPRPMRLVSERSRQQGFVQCSAATRGCVVACDIFFNTFALNMSLVKQGLARSGISHVWGYNEWEWECGHITICAFALCNF